jgi:alpha-tubulin suppressor-like RCC1 family protein
MAPTLAAGDGHSLARGHSSAGDGIWGWGSNNAKQVGDAMPYTAPPIFFQNRNWVTSLAAGWEHSVAIINRGVFAWGSNELGRLGTDTGRLPDGSVTPVRGVYTGHLQAISIDAGAHHSVAVTPEGSVVTWGSNEFGQIGVDPQRFQNLDRPRTVKLPSGRTALVVAAGSYHCLALLDNRTVVSWGDNEFKQLGVSNPGLRYLAKLVPNLTDVMTIAAGGQWSAAVKRDGSVWAWGANQNGQLGSGASGEQSRAQPVRVEGLPKVWRIDAGLAHGIVLANGDPFNPNLERWGEVWTWGRGTEGELGDGSTMNSPNPRQVPSIERACAIAAGSMHNLAIVPSGRGGGVVAWGRNSEGQLGPPISEQRQTPITVEGVSSGYESFI